MPSKILVDLLKNSQQTAFTSVLAGYFKGIVEDVRDPLCLGRVKVRIYSLDGDYTGYPTDNLVWCEVVQHIRGSFSPPELWDRVWVSFEAGDRKRPVVVGYWYAVPAGRGNLPFNSKLGSEVPREAWSHSGLSPQATVLGKTGEGSSIWFDERSNNKVFISSTNIQNAGGSGIKIVTFMPGEKDYSPVGKIGDPASEKWELGKVHRSDDILSLPGAQSTFGYTEISKGDQVEQYRTLSSNRIYKTSYSIGSSSNLRFSQTIDNIISWESDGNYLEVRYKNTKYSLNSVDMTKLDPVNMEKA